MAERGACGPDARPIEATIAERCIYGVDSDPIAVELAILALSLETGARPRILARHLCAGDLLSAGIPSLPARFDAVLGNPPWGAAYSAQERERLAQRFPRSTQRSFDSFKLFLDLASQLTSGTLGMVVPQSVLAQTTHDDVRRLLLDRLDPLSPHASCTPAWIERALWTCHATVAGTSGVIQ